MEPESIKFIISRKSSAYLVVVNDCDVVIEPHYDEVRRFATEHMALALQNLSRGMLEARSFPDPCEFLLQFFARKGWRIEDADIETSHES